MPRQGIILTYDHACAALQTAFVIHENLITFGIMCVQLGRTHIEARPQRASLATDFMIDNDVRGFFVNLEDIAAQLVLKAQGLDQARGIIQNHSQPPQIPSVAQS
jgi:hypothetical protein